MGEELKVSAYAISVAGSEQNLDNIFVNGRYLTSASAEEHAVINKVAHADFQVYAVCDGQVSGETQTEEDVFPAAVTMQRLQRLQSIMAEENRIDKDRIWDFLTETNSKMKEYKEAVGAEEASASFAALFLHGNRGLAVHLGDSRIYVIRGGRMLQITEDHLLATDMYKYGVITQKQAEVHKKNSGLTAYLGMDDIYDAEDTVFSKFFVFYPDDIFIICSDGITDYISNEDLERIVRGMKDATADEVAQTLISTVDEVSEDDKSIVVLKVDDAPGSAAPQRGTSAMPQPQNFGDVQPEEPQVPVTDTTKLSSITTGVQEAEAAAEDDDYDDDYDEESIIDRILGNPKRLAIVLGGILVLIILIALIAKGCSRKSSTTNDSSTATSDSVISESTEASVEESSEESVITESSDSSEDSESSDSSNPFDESAEDSDTNEDSDSSADTDTETVSYTVESGDSPWAILTDRYGSYSDAIWNAVAQYNGIGSEDYLEVGQTILLPPLSELGVE